MINKDLLILERSSSSLDLKTENGAYVLEGIFGELDKRTKTIVFIRLKSMFHK